MDRGAWRATVHRVTQSRTWLKGLNTHFCSANLSYNPVLYIPNAYSVWPLECLIDIANNEIQNWTSVSLATSALPTGFQWMAVPFFQLLRPKTLAGSQTPLSFSHHTWFISKSCWGSFQHRSQMWPFLITYSARGLVWTIVISCPDYCNSSNWSSFFFTLQNPPVPQTPSPQSTVTIAAGALFKMLVTSYKPLFKTFISHCPHVTPAPLYWFSHFCLNASGTFLP